MRRILLQTMQRILLQILYPPRRWACGLAAAWVVGVPHISAAQTLQDSRVSGNTFLSPALQALQNDAARNPITLWLERGQTLWQAQCASCHGDISTLKTAAATFPKLAPDGLTLRNIEDQIVHCNQRHGGNRSDISLDSDTVLALSAALHQAAKGQPINAAPVQAHLANGERLYTTRMGRINLACTHCHDGKVGAAMRGEVVSQAQPTGFPIFRQSWQTLGSIDRRLRACYSGVQAPIPAIGSAELRDLELFLKVRAQGMPLDGASIRR
jgi:L-cysteine S-thiosulfotransferase